MSRRTEMLVMVVTVITLTALAQTCVNITHAEPAPKYKIAILDTGYDVARASTPLKLCKTGHYEFRTNTPIVGFTQIHGTLVASIIAEQLKNINYCALIYQVETKDGHFLDQSLTRAVSMAIKEGANVVNMSYQGYTTSLKERFALERLSASGAITFEAAGNEGENLDYQCDAFPTCYGINNIFPVGAIDPDTATRAKYSNHGKMIKLWFSGRATLNGDEYNGTSFAAPRALSDYILRKEKRK